jgi:hypothetical protein
LPFLDASRPPVDERGQAKVLRLAMETLDPIKYEQTRSETNVNTPENG